MHKNKQPKASPPAQANRGQKVFRGSKTTVERCKFMWICEGKSSQYSAGRSGTRTLFNFDSSSKSFIALKVIVSIFVLQRTRATKLSSRSSAKLLQLRHGSIRRKSSAPSPRAVSPVISSAPLAHVAPFHFQESH